MEVKINLLIVDDEQIILDSIKKHLNNEENIYLYTALSVEQAKVILENNEIHIVLTDLMLPGVDGLEFLRIIKDKNPSIIVIMITGYATINTALQAMQLGAFDYIAKPFTRDELKKVVRRASELVRVTSRVRTSGNVESGSELGESRLVKSIGENTWMVLQEDGSVHIGVERPFLINIGRIQTVYLPSKGDEIRQGSIFFQAFSDDLRSQVLLSPLSGTVVEVNKKVYDDPNLALQDPYGDGWLIILKPTNFDEEIKLMGL
jgi:CheY-like chemotaxis protein/glycine cleavage system H lipoate-binding protein